MSIIKELEILADLYGENITLSEAIKRKKGKNIYKCPQCDGEGHTIRCIPGEYGYTADRYVEEECNLCHGIGYTEHEYKPKMVQDGWE